MENEVKTKQTKKKGDFEVGFFFPELEFCFVVVFACFRRFCDLLWNCALSGCWENGGKGVEIEDEIWTLS